MLLQLADQAEIIIAISAKDIEENKIRGDLQIPYDEDVLRLIREFQNKGLYVSSVVITHYNGQKSAERLKKNSPDRISKLIIITTLKAIRQILRRSFLLKGLERMILFRLPDLL